MADGRRGKLYYRIGEVAAMVGVEPHVLRYWESEFRIRPHRSSSGHRLYRREEIERFLRIQRLLHREGFTIAGARRALARGEGVEAADPELLRELRRRLEAVSARLESLLAEPSPLGIALPEAGAVGPSGGVPVQEEEPEEDDVTAEDLLEP